jgi:hypothetical protein
MGAVSCDWARTLSERSLLEPSTIAGIHDPLYLFACQLDWQHRRNLAAYQALVSALDDSDQRIRAMKFVRNWWIGKSMQNLSPLAIGNHLGMVGTRHSLAYANRRRLRRSKEARKVPKFWLINPGLISQVTKKSLVKLSPFAGLVLSSFLSTLDIFDECRRMASTFSTLSRLIEPPPIKVSDLRSALQFKALAPQLPGQ